MIYEIKKFGTAVANAVGRFKAIVAANAAGAESTRTFACDVKGLKKLSAIVDWTKHVGTAIVLTWYYSLDNGTTYAQVTTQATTAGAVTWSPRVDTRTLAGSAAAGFELELGAWDKVKCVVAITGGDATDLFDVYATGAT